MIQRKGIKLSDLEISILASVVGYDNLFVPDDFCKPRITGEFCSEVKCRTENLLRKGSMSYMMEGYFVVGKDVIDCINLICTSPRIVLFYDGRSKKAKTHTFYLNNSFEYVYMTKHNRSRLLMLNDSRCSCDIDKSTTIDYFSIDKSDVFKIKKLFDNFDESNYKRELGKLSISLEHKSLLEKIISHSVPFFVLRVFERKDGIITEKKNVLVVVLKDKLIQISLTDDSINFITPDVANLHEDFPFIFK